MSSEASPDVPPPVDVGLLSPLTVGHDDLVSDAAFVDALVTVEVALTLAWGSLSIVPPDGGLPLEARTIATTFGAEPAPALCRTHGIDAGALAAASVSGGNPVIALVGMMRERVPAEARSWIHRGATSQDILDSAVMLAARDAVHRLGSQLREVASRLAAFATDHADEVTAARTLTQHAVPTTLGLRAAGWARGVAAAIERLDALDFPAQLGGAGGTQAAFVEWVADGSAVQLLEEFAVGAGLKVSYLPWHTERSPITRLGDALVQTTDALGKLATDIATLSRTELGEVAEGVGGGSSAMPQKQNPVRSVLIRSAAMRAPQLGATLHLAAALAGDERPDGAWHAEWPTLRELLRLALGAASHAEHLVAGLQVDHVAVARNLALTNGLIVSERLGIVLRPLIGKERFDALIAEATSGADLGALVRALPEARGLDVEALLSPAAYIGRAREIVDQSVELLRRRGIE